MLAIRFEDDLAMTRLSDLTGQDFDGPWMLYAFALEDLSKDPTML